MNYIEQTAATHWSQCVLAADKALQPCSNVYSYGTLLRNQQIKKRLKREHGIVKLLIVLLLMLPLTGWTENGQQILQLEKALMRVQQETQAVHQQFLMIQELRRNEISGSPAADIPSATVQSTPLPKYEEMMQRQQERKERIERYTADLDRLYARFNALNDERESLMDQIRLLEQLPLD